MKDRTLKDEGNPRGVAGECEEQEARNIGCNERYDNTLIVESYNNGLVPQDIALAADQSGEAEEDEDGKKYVLVGEYMTMTKLLFKNYRLLMYSFLNRELRSDRLRYFAGFKALNRVINRDVCEFGPVTYWRIDREDLIADVEVNLSLDKSVGEVKRLKGYLVLWFDLNKEWKRSVESIERNRPDRTGLTMLSPYLIPYYKSHDLDVASEEIWQKYLIEALYDREQRSPEALAERMGLNIVYHPLYKDRTIESILFFKEGKIDTVDESKQIFHKQVLPYQVFQRTIWSEH